MTEKIMLAGVGGQGVQALGKILASAALSEGKNVTWLPSYGAEMRGGPSNCNVIISDEEIGSPSIDRAAALLAMSQSAVDRFEKLVETDGLICVNTSLIKHLPKRSDVQIKTAAISDIAVELGDARYANMVMLGAYLSLRPVLLLETIQSEIKNLFGKKSAQLVEINIKAIEMGAAAIQ